MASRHHSLDLTESRDLIQLVRDFEEHCHVKLVLAFSVLDKGKVPELFVSATAYPPELTGAERAPLASVSLHSSSTNLKTIIAVATHVLYMLDGKLAWREMQGGEENRA